MSCQCSMPFGSLRPGRLTRVLLLALPTLLAVSTAARSEAAGIPEIDGPVLRIGYLVPSDREPNPATVERAAQLLRWYQLWYASEMDRHGYGVRSFPVEVDAAAVQLDPDRPVPMPAARLRLLTEPSPLPPPDVHVVPLPRPASYYRGDASNKKSLLGRVRDDAEAAGVPLGTDGQSWWLLTDMQELQPDGTLAGTHRQGGVRTANWSGATVCDVGILPAITTDALTNDRPYDGLTVPAIGPHPLRFGKSFKASRGRSVSSVVSATLGSSLHEIGHSLGLVHDFRSDANFRGNLMGNGLRGFRGWLAPAKYPDDDVRLTTTSARVLSLSPLFADDRADDRRPARFRSAELRGDGPDGRPQLHLDLEDDHELALVFAFVNGRVVAEAPLSGPTQTVSLPFWEFQPGPARGEVWLLDAGGNLTVRPVGGTIEAPSNRPPRPALFASALEVTPGTPVQLDAAESADPDGGPLQFAWDMNGDGTADTDFAARPIRTFRQRKAGRYRVAVVARDRQGAESVSLPLVIAVRKR